MTDTDRGFETSGEEAAPVAAAHGGWLVAFAASSTGEDWGKFMNVHKPVLTTCRNVSASRAVGQSPRSRRWSWAATTMALALFTGLLMLLPARPAEAAVDKQPLIVALCHGNNQTWPQNFDQSHFEHMFTETGGSETVADYWRDISHGRFSLQGSRVLDVQLDVPRDAIGDRDDNDFKKCRDGVNDQYSVDWDKFSGPVVIKPHTEGRTVNAIDKDDTEVQVRAEGPSVMDDWPSPPFTLVLTKTGTLWRNAQQNIENVKVTAVSKDHDTGIATFTIEREKAGYRQRDKPIPPAKSWDADTIVKDITDTYGSKNRAVASADTDPSIITHELGHFLGFSHSRRLSTANSPYGDCFDVMSTLTCPSSHYFKVPFKYPGGELDQWNGPGMTSVFLDLKDWIAADDRTEFAPTDCRQETYSMRALGLGGSEPQQIRVPVSVEIRDGVMSEYLTVELRSQQFTWDQGIPRDAFVLHLKGDDGLSYLVDDAEAGRRRGMDAGDYYVFDAGTSDPDDDRFFFVNGIDDQNGTGQITLASCPFTSELTYGGPTTFTYHTFADVSATFELETGAAAPGGVVTFALADSDCSDRIPFTDQEEGTGAAVCDLDIDMKPGAYTLTARWEGIDDVFAPAEDTVEVTVDKRGTELTVDQPVDTTYHDPVTLRATLEEEFDEDDSNPGYHPVSGRVVELSIGSGTTAQSCTATTNSTGSVECTIDSVEQRPDGSVAVNAEFAGDDYYRPSADADTFAVLKRPTELTVAAPSFAANAGSVELTGTLVEAGTPLADGGTPITGRSVVLTLGEDPDAQSCVTLTDSSGEASCEIDPVDQQLGPQAISAAFAGDDYYLPSADDDELIIFEWTGGGHFVVGDGSAVEDATVTFWSSEWHHENTVSGGPAPASFKGFASRPSGPTDCATTTSWRSSGGNSADAPDEVPEYTAMLVTDSVERNGRGIVGSSVSIAIVRVDSGYQSEPGHSSTATVLGFLCTD